MNVLSMECIAVYFVLFFLRNQSLYPIKHSPDNYWPWNIMSIIVILSFERYNQKFSKSIIIFSFLQLQFSLLNQCSNNEAHSEYRITLLHVRHKPR